MSFFSLNVPATAAAKPAANLAPDDQLRKINKNFNQVKKDVERLTNIVDKFSIVNPHEIAPNLLVTQIPLVKGSANSVMNDIEYSTLKVIQRLGIIKEKAPANYKKFRKELKKLMEGLYAKVAKDGVNAIKQCAVSDHLLVHENLKTNHRRGNAATTVREIVDNTLTRIDTLRRDVLKLRG